MSQADVWNNWTPPQTLQECVTLLFEILDATEMSSEGREFHPTVIRSCRTWDQHRLDKLLKHMKSIA